MTIAEIKELISAMSEEQKNRYLFGLICTLRTEADIISRNDVITYLDNDCPASVLACESEDKELEEDADLDS